jgi:hypothetical protein
MKIDFNRKLDVFLFIYQICTKLHDLKNKYKGGILTAI